MSGKVNDAAQRPDIFRVFVGLVVLNAAIAYPAAAQTAPRKIPPTKSAEFAGQVFVVTEGRQTIKLSLVELQAIPESALLVHLEKTRRALAEERALIDAKVEEAQRSVEEAANREKAAREAEKTESKARTDAMFASMRNRQWNSERSREHAAAEVAGMRAALDARDEAEAKRRAYLELLKQQRLLRNPSAFFANLPKPAARTKTDADGRFRLPVPPGKHVIAAHSDRRLLNGTEEYFWLLSVDSASPDQALMLTNDNLVQSRCSECVSLD
jgi:multidrug resistance efflux pump